MRAVLDGDETPSLTIIPSIYGFREGTVQGDFFTMIADPAWKDALFVFNDNVEHHKTAYAGGGNAKVRPFNQFGAHRGYPRSAGVPTGSLARGGFTNLDPESKSVIDFSIDEITDLARLHGYRRLVYSAGDDGRTLGAGIFAVDPTVLAYITDRIWQIPAAVMAGKVAHCSYLG